MLKTFASLLVALSLLIAPLVHASEVCIGDACQMSERVQKSSEGDQDKSKTADVSHHCCTQASDRCVPQVSQPMLMGANSPFPIENETATSLVLGLPLKPPAHA